MHSSAPSTPLGPHHYHASRGRLASSLFPSAVQSHEVPLLCTACRLYRRDKGNSEEQQERADVAAAQAHFVLLGWPADCQESLSAGNASSSSACDEWLAALLRRAAALQEARQRGGVVDWEDECWR